MSLFHIIFFTTIILVTSQAITPQKEIISTFDISADSQSTKHLSFSYGSTPITGVLNHLYYPKDLNSPSPSRISLGNKPLTDYKGSQSSIISDLACNEEDPYCFVATNNGVVVYSLSSNSPNTNSNGFIWFNNSISKDLFNSEYSVQAIEGIEMSDYFLAAYNFATLIKKWDIIDNQTYFTMDYSNTRMKVSALQLMAMTYTSEAAYLYTSNWEIGIMDFTTMKKVGAVEIFKSLGLNGRMTQLVTINRTLIYQVDSRLAIYDVGQSEGVQKAIGNLGVVVNSQDAQFITAYKEDNYVVVGIINTLYFFQVSKEKITKVDFTFTSTSDIRALSYSFKKGQIAILTDQGVDLQKFSYETGLEGLLCKSTSTKYFSFTSAGCSFCKLPDGLRKDGMCHYTYYSIWKEGLKSMKVPYSANTTIYFSLGSEEIVIEPEKKDYTLIYIVVGLVILVVVCGTGFLCFSSKDTNSLGQMKENQDEQFGAVPPIEAFPQNGFQQQQNFGFMPAGGRNRNQFGTAF